MASAAPNLLRNPKLLAAQLENIIEKALIRRSECDESKIENTSSSPERHVVTNFNGSNLAKSDLAGVTAHKGQFNGSALHGSDFSGTDLTGSSFKSNDVRKHLFLIGSFSLH
jgi:Pentapeptide repeats (8 copies).